MGEPSRDYSHDDRLALGQATLSLLADWGLNSQQQAAMLGLDDKSVSIDMISGGEALPQDDDVLDRASRFLNLSIALNALYNYETSMLQHWMVQRNEDLGGQTPFEFIREYGVTGLAWLEDFISQQLASRNRHEVTLDMPA